MFSRRVRLAVGVITLVLLLPGVSAATWTIDGAALYPMNTSAGSSMVVLINVSDDQGKPVNPMRCDAAGDAINNLYEYPSGADRKPLIHLSETPSWYLNSSLTAEQGADTVVVYAGGQCNGVDVVSVTQNLSLEPDGNLSVSFLTDTSQELVPDREMTVAWNVSNGSRFLPDATLSYQVYNLTGNIVTQGSTVTGDVELQADRFAANISVPRAGQHVVNVNVSTTSQYLRPYGGAAAPLTVRGRLAGRVVADYPDDRCSGGAWVRCEKGSVIELQYWEEVEDATGVVVDVNGSGQVYDTVQLQPWNSTTWNGTFRVSEDYDTTVYGTNISIRANASNQLSYTIIDALASGRQLGVAAFTVLDSTQQFVQAGDDIELVAGPVTAYTGLPVTPDNISRVNVSVRNADGAFVFNRALQPPFTDTYDPDRRMFVTSYTVPDQTVTGEYPATVTVTDVYGVTRSHRFTFKVLDRSSAETSVLIERIIDTREPGNLSHTYATPGNRTAAVVLENVADNDALVDVFFTGFSGTGFPQSMTVPAQSNRTLTLNMSLPATGTYQGTVAFFIHGPNVVPYNITVPANISVGTGCVAQDGDLCVSGIDTAPYTVTDSFMFPITVRNDAATDTTVFIEPVGNISDLFTSKTMTVPGGGQQTVELAGDGAPGYYSGTFAVSTDDEFVSVPVTFTVEEARLQVSVPDDLGTFVAGVDVPLPVTVENTGADTITALDVTVDTLRIFESRSVSLPPGASTTVSFTGTAPNLGGAGTVTVFVDADTDASASTTTAITAYQNFTDSFNSIEEDAIELEQELSNRTGENTSQVAADLQRLEELVQQGRSAAAAGEYDVAQRRFDEANSLQQDIRSAVNRLPETERDGAGLPVAVIVVVLVVLLVVGAILYLSLVPEDREGGPPMLPSRLPGE